VDVRDTLTRGDAYEKTSSTFINSFEEPLRIQIIMTYQGALQRVWQISLVFAVLGFVAAWGLREIKSKKELETEYGMRQKEVER
jgi:hypothetical protein